MNKQCVRWKTFKAKSVRGMDYDSSLTDLIDLHNKGTLVARILAMEKKQPITVEQAMMIAHDHYYMAMLTERIGDAPGECFWYLGHFVEWISGLGYHIELSGDEFESYALSAKLN